MKKMRERAGKMTERVNLDVERINKAEVRGTHEEGEEWKLYNRTMERERMPEDWNESVLIPIFKNNGDVQSCSNYRGIKLISHTMKLWERVFESRLRSE